LDKFVQAVRNAGIRNFDVAIPEKGAKIKIPGLTGPKVNKIMSSYKKIVKSYCKEEKLLTDSLKVWELWFKICSALQQETVDPTTFSNLEEDLNQFGKQFILTYGEQNVTPYIHIVVCHTMPWLRKYGSIGRYSQQGFEATHKWHKQIYYFSTNHNGKVSQSKILTSSIEQILSKIYRMHLKFLLLKSWQLSTMVIFL